MKRKPSVYEPGIACLLSLLWVLAAMMASTAEAGRDHQPTKERGKVRPEAGVTALILPEIRFNSARPRDTSISWEYSCECESDGTVYQIGGKTSVTIVTYGPFYHLQHKVDFDELNDLQWEGLDKQCFSIMMDGARFSGGVETRVLKQSLWDYVNDGGAGVPAAKSPEACWEKLSCSGKRGKYFSVRRYGSRRKDGTTLPTGALGYGRLEPNPGFPKRSRY